MKPLKETHKKFKQVTKPAYIGADNDYVHILKMYIKF